ncbi:MAG: putative lipid II flippase FtsW [Proteobacteria bacterium]|nr:putative lipid II flippase FtsW [Pseudomonadota bacterium]
MTARVVNIPRQSLYLLVTWVVLLVFGTIMVGSASVAMPGDYIVKQLVNLCISLFLAVVVLTIPLTTWTRFYWLGWILSLFLVVLVLVPGVGYEVKGATRWVRIGGFSLQSVEVAKFGLMIFLAGYLTRYHDMLQQSPNRILIPLAMVFIVCALVVAEPDLGSAAVVLATTLSVLFMAGAKLRFVLLMVVGGALLFALMVWLEPFRMRRMAAFTDPWAVPFDTGYQLVQALIAFGRGELLGLGLGEGIQKLSYLPEAHNDFIFAVIAEELGSIGAIALIVLYTFFVAMVLSVAKRSLQTGNLFAGYCCYFVGFIFAYQFLVNVGVNVGVLPTKGLTLPFISYGGNSLMVSCALFAFVLRCSWVEEMAPATSRKSSVGR